jgi:hypothetical protein
VAGSSRASCEGSGSGFAAAGFTGSSRFNGISPVIAPDAAGAGSEGFLEATRGGGAGLRAGVASIRAVIAGVINGVCAASAFGTAGSRAAGYRANGSPSRTPGRRRRTRTSP